MESIDQVKRGIANFIDGEVAPIMPRWKGVLLSAGAALMIEGKSNEILKNPMVQMIGIIDGDMVDVDKLYSTLKVKAQGKWPIEISGLKMSETDMDKLYQYIKGA